MSLFGSNTNNPTTSNSANTPFAGFCISQNKIKDPTSDKKDHKSDISENATKSNQTLGGFGSFGGFGIFNTNTSSSTFPKDHKTETSEKGIKSNQTIGGFGGFGDSEGFRGSDGFRSFGGFQESGGFGGFSYFNTNTSSSTVVPKDHKTEISENGFKSNQTFGGLGFFSSSSTNTSSSTVVPNNSTNLQQKGFTTNTETNETTSLFNSQTNTDKILTQPTAQGGLFGRSLYNSTSDQQSTSGGILFRPPSSVNPSNENLPNTSNSGSNQITNNPIFIFSDVSGPQQFRQNTTKKYMGEELFFKIREDQVIDDCKFFFEDFKCPVCLNLLKNPKSCNYCTNNFCEDCYENLSNNNIFLCVSICPICKNYSNSFKIIDKKLLNILLKFKVYCPKCNEITPYGELDNHLNECAKCIFKCLGKGCNFIGLKDEIEEHIKVCSFTLDPCKLCFKEVMRKDVYKHMEEECPEEKIKCKFCSTTFKRKDEKDHTREVCILLVSTARDHEVQSLKEEIERLKLK
jgi:hypothetical protein